MVPEVEWLHYDQARDLAFCHTCIKALRTGKIQLSGNARDSPFLPSGFANWKDAVAGFNKNEKTTTHKQAVEVVLTTPATTGDVGEQLSSEYAQQCATNRRCLTIIAQNIRFLPCQGIALRGDGKEGDSNFTQLLLFRGYDNQELLLWLDRKTNKYASPEI